MATFDSERALEDVEKLREQVLHAREERRRAEEAFEAFTSGFRTQAPPPKAAAEIHSRSGAVRAATPPNASETGSEMSHAMVTPKRARRANGWAFLFAGVAVAAAAIFAVRMGQPSPQDATPEQTPATPASTPQPAVDAPIAIAKPPASLPVGASGVNLEVTTRRRVWMRVTLDGQRAFAREVAADQHIPLHADRSITIRAGDGGAVEVRQNGREAGPLGRDGVVATREFTTAARLRQ